jgi:excinuclease ABC subunit A
MGCQAIDGAETVTAVREVDQRPIGRTPRSTPATYVGFWNSIRNVFASSPEARARGYTKRRFSFNVAGGRCDTCAGQGRLRMEMNFLPDVDVDCEVCGGRRFNPETLEIKYRGKNVADILEMPVEEALEFFENYPELSRSLAALGDLGLGYLTLGQASTTLSGGEAQRVKLAVELVKTSGGACLYLLDEPTTGLHMQDVECLVAVLRRFAAAGHAVVVIEHHLELIAGADWVVDLGPEGADEGGELLFQGAPAKLVKAWRKSHTARCLRDWVERFPKVPPATRIRTKEED